MSQKISGQIVRTGAEVFTVSTIKIRRVRGSSGLRQQWAMASSDSLESIRRRYILGQDGFPSVTITSNQQPDDGL